MLKRQLLIGLIASLLILGLSSLGLAGEQGSEAGMEISATQTAWDAALTHNYDQDRLNAIGTEAGNYGVNFDSNTTKSDIAASNHNYDQEQLNAIGTEAGVYSLETGPVCMAC